MVGRGSTVLFFKVLNINIPSLNIGGVGVRQRIGTGRGYIVNADAEPVRTNDSLVLSCPTTGIKIPKADRKANIVYDG